MVLTFEIIIDVGVQSVSSALKFRHLFWNRRNVYDRIIAMSTSWLLIPKINTKHWFPKPLRRIWRYYSVIDIGIVVLFDEFVSGLLFDEFVLGLLFDEFALELLFDEFALGLLLLSAFGPLWRRTKDRLMSNERSLGVEQRIAWCRTKDCSMSNEGLLFRCQHHNNDLNIENKAVSPLT